MINKLHTYCSEFKFNKLYYVQDFKYQRQSLSENKSGGGKKHD